jgi:hypothetical protein
MSWAYNVGAPPEGISDLLQSLLVRPQPANSLLTLPLVEGRVVRWPGIPFAPLLGLVDRLDCIRI